MMAVDTNVLVYAHREEMPLHDTARDRLVAIAEAPDAWALPVFCIAEFLRVVTHPRLFEPPTTTEEGIQAIAALCESPSLRILNPGERYWSLLCEVLRQSGARGNLLFDAQIVAVCREHGVQEILSEDRDFTRFSGIWLHTL